MVLVAPSILASDFSNLSQDIALVNDSTADYLHVDVMDGVFVPNISFGQGIVKTMGRLSTKPLDVHLMITRPERYFEDFVNAGAQMLTFHIEASDHVHRHLSQIKEMGIKAGIALNPHTPVQMCFDVLELLDVVLLMSVNPGFGGQKFIYQTIQKTKDLKAEIIARNTATKIEIDGGVGLQNAEVLAKAGADILVAGSSVFKSQDPKDTIEKLKLREFSNFDF